MHSKVKKKQALLYKNTEYIHFSNKFDKLRSYYESYNLSLVVDYPSKVYPIYMIQGHVKDLCDES